MGEVIAFPKHRVVQEPLLTKRQVADWYGHTTRWVELRVAEQMPSYLRNGRRVFLLSEISDWLDDRESGTLAALQRAEREELE